MERLKGLSFPSFSSSPRVIGLTLASTNAKRTNRENDRRDAVGPLGGDYSPDKSAKTSSYARYISMISKFEDFNDFSISLPPHPRVPSRAHTKGYTTTYIPQVLSRSCKPLLYYVTILRTFLAGNNAP